MRKKYVIKVAQVLVLFLCAIQFTGITTEHADAAGKWYYQNPFAADGKTYFGPYDTKEACINGAKGTSFVNSCVEDTGNIPASKIHFVGVQNDGTTGTRTYTPSSSDTDYKLISPQTETPVYKKTYRLLAPIGDLTCIENGEGESNPGCVTGNVGTYLNIIFRIAIGLAAALAVVMIVVYSIAYMGNESVFGKNEAKSNILSSIGGLLIALGAYALLASINPDLVGTSGATVDQVVLEIGGDVDAPIGGTLTLPAGIICSGGKSNIPAIAKSFNQKMTYSQSIPKGQAGPNGTIKLDCSGYVNYVLKCAGVSFVNGGTASIFANAEKVTSISGTKVNGVELKVGDLLGWKGSDNGTRFKGNGHVMIYIGNGTVADSHGPANKTGKAYGSFSIDKYKQYITYIKRAP